jgi:phage terminase large subunit
MVLSPDRYKKGQTRVFILDFSDHPEKQDPDWFLSRKKKAIDEGLYHIFASEVERRYDASVTGVLIPAAHVLAAIDAEIDLDFPAGDGWYSAALDVADGVQGGDVNALAIRRGVRLERLDTWGEIDVGMTTRRAIHYTREYWPLAVQYDCIGVGSGVKSEYNRLISENIIPDSIKLIAWNAGASPLWPDKNVVESDRQSPTWKDFALNLRIQGWWNLRLRFERVWRLRNDPTLKGTWSPDELISIPKDLPLLSQLQKELSQPTLMQNSRMRIFVDKKPEGTRSPNLADAVMMAFWPVNAGRSMLISADTLMRSRYQNLLTKHVKRTLSP